MGGRVVRDPEFPTDPSRDEIVIDGETSAAVAPLYLMLNKPRGLVTTANDERGRDTVYRCFDGARLDDGHPLPWIAPVGRLDKASEGLLLFTNDNTWANRVTDPATHVPKTYHVQVSGLVDDRLLQKLTEGVVDQGERLELREVSILRQGEKNTWLEIILDEGRNRHIRRVLAAHDLEVLRLVRIAIGSLGLGDLAKGGWRDLSDSEIRPWLPHPR